MINFLIFFLFLSWQNIKEHYKDVETVYAEFKEVVFSDDIPIDTLEGKLYVKRPDFLKMVVEKPETQIIYSDPGSTLVYLPSWNQVQVYATPKFIPDFFLLNIQSYMDSSHSSFDGEYERWKIFLKKELNLPYLEIDLILNKKNKLLKILSLIEKEVRFDFIFSEFQINPIFRKEIFEINLPKNIQRIKVNTLDK